MQIKAPLETAG